MEQERTLRRFVHAMDIDGDMDSICIYCFEVVGTAVSEDALRSYEKEHCCQIDLRVSEVNRSSAPSLNRHVAGE